VGDMNVKVPNIVVSLAKRVGWGVIVFGAALDYAILNFSKQPQIENRSIEPIELFSKILTSQSL
jgi:hypothetical protein